MRIHRKLPYLGVVSFALAVQLGAADRDVRLVTAAERGDRAAVSALIRERADVNQTAGDGSTALLWAVYRSDASMARTLLQAGARVEIENNFGVAPLLQASRLGDLAMIRILLQAGANPNTVYREGETALMAASAAGNAEAVKLFIARGADVNAKEQGEAQTALMWAADGGHADVIKVLLAAGADPKAVAKPKQLDRARGGGSGGRMFTDHARGGLTALMFAARQGEIESARALIEGGADLNHANPDGLTALILATINDRIDVAGLLVEKRANPDDGSLLEAVRVHNLRTNETTGEATRPRPIHANTLTHLDLIRMLVEHGADPNKVATHTLHVDGTGTPGPVNQSAIAAASASTDVEALRVMLTGRAADQTLADAALSQVMATVGGGAGGGRGRGGFAGGFGATPAGFRYASERTPSEAAKLVLDVVKQRLDAGADVNAARPNGETALHTAAQTGNVPLIQLLASRGAKLDAQNMNEFTPLDLAMGRQAPNANAAANGPPGGGQGGGQAQGGGGRGRGGPGGPGGGPQPQLEAVAVLRQLMGLPPLAPSDIPAAAPAPPAGRRGN